MAHDASSRINVVHTPEPLYSLDRSPGDGKGYRTVNSEIWYGL